MERSPLNIKCYMCGEEKPETEFYRDRTRSNGRTSRSKPCDIEYTRTDYYRHQERRLKVARIYENRKHRERQRKTDRWLRVVWHARKNYHRTRVLMEYAARHLTKCFWTHPKLDDYLAQFFDADVYEPATGRRCHFRKHGMRYLSEQGLLEQCQANFLSTRTSSSTAPQQLSSA